MLQKRFMKKKYFFALTNLVLLVPFTLFFWYKFLFFEECFKKLGREYDLVDILKTMRHYIIILVISILSLMGILFWSQKKAFFFISTFYSAIQLVLLFLTPSLSFYYTLMTFSVITFLWFLIWSNTFPAFENKRGLKLIFLIIGIVIYIPIFLFG